MKKTLFFLQSLALLLSFSSSFAETLTVAIQGVEGDVKENIESTLNIGHLEKINTQTEIQLFYQTAPAEIKKALQPFGYFNPTIQSLLIPKNNTWLATFNITVGPPVRINVLDIRLLGEGANNSHFINAINDSKLEEGRVFSAAEYNELHNRLLAVATDFGFFDAQMLKDELTIDLRNNTANIVLHFDTGRRYRFGEVNFSKNPFDTSFLKRFLPFSQGEHYNINKVQKLQEDLVGSNYFRSAWINPESDKRKNGEIPIDVELTARTPRQYSLGAGFGTDTGVRGSAGIQLRRLTPTGHRFNADIQASQINSNVQMAYTIPGTNPVTDQYFLTSTAENQNDGLGDGDFQKISAGFTKKLHTWLQTLSLSFQRERSALNNEPFETQYMLIPQGTWEHISRNDPIKVSRGTHVLFTLQGTPSLFGNTAFTQGLASIKTIQPLGKNRVVARAELGYTWINDVKNLPLSFQLSAGGAQSVRGYSYNSIGPGSTLAVGSVEYRQRVKEDWYAAAFFEAGSVNNSFFTDFNKGTGLGVVWQSPLGAFALSIARGINNDATMIQFNMGPDL